MIHFYPDMVDYPKLSCQEVGRSVRPNAAEHNNGESAKSSVITHIRLLLELGVGIRGSEEPTGAEDPVLSRVSKTTQPLFRT